MAITTPVERTSDHKSWHTFMRGGCFYCGWHCDDCPKGVATCRCKGTAEEIADELLDMENSRVTEYWE